MRIARSLLQNPYIHIEPYVSSFPVYQIWLYNYVTESQKGVSYLVIALIFLVFIAFNWHCSLILLVVWKYLKLVYLSSWAFPSNVTFFFSLQLHQLMPSIITCLVAKRLGNRFSDNHWELRNFTANLVASICKR